MKSTWKSIAVIVAVVVVIAVITLYFRDNWTTVVNEALCTIQSNIGLTTHFHFGTFTCHAI